MSCTLTRNCKDSFEKRWNRLKMETMRVESWGHGDTQTFCMVNVSSRGQTQSGMSEQRPSTLMIASLDTADLLSTFTTDRSLPKPNPDKLTGKLNVHLKRYEINSLNICSLMKLYIKVECQISGTDDDHLSTFIGLLLLSWSIHSSNSDRPQFPWSWWQLKLPLLNFSFHLTAEENLPNKRYLQYKFEVEVVKRNRKVCSIASPHRVGEWNEHFRSVCGTVAMNCRSLENCAESG